MGDINIKIKSRNLYLIFTVIVFLVGAGLVLAVWNPNNIVYHSSDNVKVNIAGTDYSLQEAVDQGRIGGGSLDCTLVEVTQNIMAFYCPAGYVVTGVGTNSTSASFSFTVVGNNAGIVFRGLVNPEIGQIRCCKII